MTALIMCGNCHKGISAEEATKPWEPCSHCGHVLMTDPDEIAERKRKNHEWHERIEKSRDEECELQKRARDYASLAAEAIQLLRCRSWGDVTGICDMPAEERVYRQAVTDAALSARRHASLVYEARKRWEESR